jgi:hypothetical protein
MAGSVRQWRTFYSYRNVTAVTDSAQEIFIAQIPARHAPRIFHAWTPPPRLPTIPADEHRATQDLGEAIHGDVPATSQRAHPDKSERERRDLLTLMAPLDATLRGELLALWEEYEAAASPEAKAVKALDKLETILQHSQGANPEDFDYAFNLDYGRKHTGTAPLFSALRELVDDETRRRMGAPSAPAH